MDYSAWMAVLTETAKQMIQRVISFLPNLIGALALLLAGWLLARLLRAVSARLIAAALDRLSPNPAISRSLGRTGLRRLAPGVISGVAYWLVLLVFIAAALEQLELAVMTNLIGSLAFYLPKVLLGIFIVFLGVLAGNIAFGAVAAAAASARIAHAELLGRTAQIAILLVAIVVGADQVGIQSTLLMVTVTIALGTTLGGAALAFGLGCGPVVSNIIASYYLLRTYQVGQTVRIGDVQGRILQITQTAVILDTPDQRVVIPAKKFSDETSYLLTAER